MITLFYSYWFSYVSLLMFRQLSKILYKVLITSHPIFHLQNDIFRSIITTIIFTVLFFLVCGCNKFPSCFSSKSWILDFSVCFGQPPLLELAFFLISSVSCFLILKKKNIVTMNPQATTSILL